MRYSSGKRVVGVGIGWVRLCYKGLDVHHGDHHESSRVDWGHQTTNKTILKQGQNETNESYSNSSPPPSTTPVNVILWASNLPPPIKHDGGCKIGQLLQVSQFIYGHKYILKQHIYIQTFSLTCQAEHYMGLKPFYRWNNNKMCYLNTFIDDLFNNWNIGHWTNT